jgi:hypothetical protein
MGVHRAKLKNPRRPDAPLPRKPASGEVGFSAFALHRAKPKIQR